MKKIYTSIVFLFSIFPFTSNAQVNTYFQNDPQWRIKLHAYSGMDCSGYEDFYNYYINGDTVLSSNVFKKVFKKGLSATIDLSCMPGPQTAYSNLAPVFFLRSAGKQIFLTLPGETNDTLLFDFNLSIGSTLPLTYNNTDPSLTVTDIDSTNTPNGYLKTFQLSNGNYLYEGIGSTGGLVEDIFPYFLSGFHTLECYSLDDTAYVLSSGGSCNLSLGIDERDDVETSVVFPNPFSTSTTIKFSHEIRNGRVQLFDLTGKKVQEINFSGSEIMIQRGVLNAGVYCYIALNGASGRLIVIE